MIMYAVHETYKTRYLTEINRGNDTIGVFDSFDKARECVLNFVNEWKEQSSKDARYKVTNYGESENGDSIWWDVSVSPKNNGLIYGETHYLYAIFLIELNKPRDMFKGFGF